MALKPVKTTENGKPATTEKAEATAKIMAEAQASAPDVNTEKLGSMSDKVEFIAPLGDPSHPDTTKDDAGNVVTTPYIVGYRLKALVDLTVPECGLGDDAKKNLMSFKDKNGTKQVKAGEEFDLTRFETGMLLAPEEFNGRITGGGKSYYATFQNLAKKDKSGKVSLTGASTDIPTVALKVDGAGSIKDQRILEVLSYTTEELENGTKRKHRTINKGFEKWAPLCVAQAPRVSQSSAPKNTRNQGARAFLEIVAKK